METKPYSLQSPEQIAKDYGGNKQRIAEAMQMGIIDPTAGTMAGMFIDRMRMAQQQEMAPQQTVAQQVFAPPAPPMGAMPPAGLGATPQAAAMPPMPGGAPMMAPPPPPPPAPPMGAPGMAAGGLTTLPLPDDMFNEPDAGGYAAGGIVAFQAGGGVDDEEGITAPAPGFPSLDTVAAAGDVPEPRGPREYYGNFMDPALMKERIEELSPQSSERRAQLNAYFDRMLSPEEQRNRRREDMWMTLGQIGARMAQTPGSLIQAASAGVSEALPEIRSAAAARRAEERGALSELARNEGLTNTESREMYRLIQEGTNRYGEFNENRLNREQQERLEYLKQVYETNRAQIMAAAGITQQRIAADASRYGSGKEFQLRRAVAYDNILADLTQNAASDPGYQAAVEGPGGLAAGQQYLRNRAFEIRDRQFGPGGGGGGGGGVIDLGNFR
jgi:hypothetical protein